MVAYISRDDSCALEHHGIKGMKWGVRQRKKEYGMSRRQVKKALKSARKAYKEPIPERTGMATGKHMHEVDKRRHKELWSDKRIGDLEKLSSDIYFLGNGTKEEWKQYDNIKKEIKARKKEISAKYVEAYKEAALKDIGYKDIEKGKKMLEDYKLVNNVTRFRKVF